MWFSLETRSEMVVSVKTWAEQLNLAEGNFDLPGHARALHTKSPLSLSLAQISSGICVYELDGYWEICATHMHARPHILKHNWKSLSANHPLHLTNFNEIHSTGMLSDSCGPCRWILYVKVTVANVYTQTNFISTRLPGIFPLRIHFPTACATHKYH